MTNRGGKGVKTLKISEKTGNLVAIKNVDDSNDLMIINKSGIVIRMAVEDLRVMGRATQGVKLINIKESDSIAAVAKVTYEEEDTTEEHDTEIENQSNDQPRIKSELNQLVMKRNSSLLLVASSIATYAQKDELKAAEKAIKKQDYTAAISAITSAESMISSMDVKSKAKFYFSKERRTWKKRVSNCC